MSHRGTLERQVSMSTIEPIHVIGAGLAGSEAAWQIAHAGVPVVLHEMRPLRGTEAHHTDGCAELVCSNSFRSDDAENNAVGVLHEEMRRAGSLIMAMGDRNRLPAGGALAVDRENFSNDVTQALNAHPLISLERGEIRGLPPEHWDAVMRQATRRAHLERSRVFRDLMRRGWRAVRQCVQRITPSGSRLEVTH